MLIGTMDTSIYQRNPYEMKNESRQTPEATDRADDASKVKLQKMSRTSNKPYDEYIPSGGKASELPGIYWQEIDRNGQPKIVFDKPDSREKSEQLDMVRRKNNGGWCTVNTDKVDAEIKKLKEAKQQIEQQIKRTGNDDKYKELKRQLSRIESELSAKDNEGYRKQHAAYTYSTEE